MSREVAKYGFLKKDKTDKYAHDPEDFSITYRNVYLMALKMLSFPFIVSQIIKLIALIAIGLYSFMLWDLKIEILDAVGSFSGVNARICTILGLYLLVYFMKTHISRYKDTKLLGDKRQNGLDDEI